LEAAGDYAGGAAKVTWAPPEIATGVSAPAAWLLQIFPPDGFTSVREMEFSTEETGYAYTPALGAADGGPWRYVTFNLRYRTIDGGVSEAAALTPVDEPPTLISAEYEAGPDSITLKTAEINGENTGVLMVRGAGPDFGIGEAVESRTVGADALPFTWDGLAPETTYYFRLAAKDAFFDIASGLLDLNYTDVRAITTPAA
jgi:hypothetical protein